MLDFLKRRKKCVCPVGKLEYEHTHRAKSSRGELITDVLRCKSCGKRHEIKAVRAKGKSEKTMTKKIQVLRHGSIMYQCDSLQELDDYLKDHYGHHYFRIIYSYETDNKLEIL